MTVVTRPVEEPQALRYVYTEHAKNCVPDFQLTGEVSKSGTMIHAVCTSCGKIVEKHLRVVKSEKKPKFNREVYHYGFEQEAEKDTTI